MCKTPKAPKPEPTVKPDMLVTRRDGVAPGANGARRRNSGLRLDLNSPSQYTGLTIPRG